MKLLAVSKNGVSSWSRYSAPLWRINYSSIQVDLITLYIISNKFEDLK